MGESRRLGYILNKAGGFVLFFAIERSGSRRESRGTIYKWVRVRERECVCVRVRERNEWIVRRVSFTKRVSER